ncbi:thiol:disulfide interchange protein DsbA/DsbL [Massilia sp. 9096]|uniref:thiol:disulfide interchange protein DsbA/DsbL n=1 Tax=Massilia sp. 9096 TaxID=1500894 RepID=UPI0005691FAE|nr:thiol:disulfide interchange protein DsbA/DsbL [Massilia sp. 9096]
MRSLHSLRFAAAGLCLLAGSAVFHTTSASPSNPANGIDYITLAQPQATQAAGKKVEVIEFFMYHCPVCNALEPQLEAWAKQEGERIQLRRIHIPLRGASDPEAHLYLALEAMGKPDAIHGQIFDLVHKQHVNLHEDGAILDWMGKNGASIGVDPAKFQEAWNTFGVQTRLRQLGKVMASYQVESAPTLVIDGRYQTSPATVSAHFNPPDRNDLFKATLEVADGLVTKAAQAK